MPAVSQNTSSVTPVSTGQSVSERKAVLAHLKSLQDKVFALMGLKMAIDKLRELKYDVVLAQEEGGACTIKITLGLQFDMDTGLVDGKDIWVVQNALQEQIKALEGK